MVDLLVRIGTKEQAVGVAVEQALLRGAKEQAAVIGVAKEQADAFNTCGAADGFKLDVQCLPNSWSTGATQGWLSLVVTAHYLVGGSGVSDRDGCGVGGVVVVGWVSLTAGSCGAGTATPGRCRRCCLPCFRSGKAFWHQLWRASFLRPCRVMRSADRRQFAKQWG